MRSTILLGAGLLACASVLTAAPSKTLSARSKNDITKAVKAELKDPDSAKFKWLAPREWGLYCGWVNAKNSYGGYTGFEPFMVIGGVGEGPKADGIVALVKIGGDDERPVIEKMCTDKGYDLSAPPAE